MKRIMVLGVGNILMGDDGIGVYLVRDLANLCKNPYVEYVVGETDVHYCLEMARQFKWVIVVDAVITGKEAGDITVFPCKKGGKYDKGISMHNLHFLEEADQLPLYWEGIIIGVECKSVSYHFGLSASLQDKYSGVLTKVNEVIQGFVSNAAL